MSSHYRLRKRMKFYQWVPDAFRILAIIVTGLVAVAGIVASATETPAGVVLLLVAPIYGLFLMAIATMIEHLEVLRANSEEMLHREESWRNRVR